MTNNNDLYEVIGTILKEFKAEIDSKIDILVDDKDKLNEQAQKAEVDLTLLDESLIYLTNENDKNNTKNKDGFELLSNIIDKIQDRLSEASKKSVDTIKSITDLDGRIERISERESDNTAASIIRHNEYMGTASDLAKEFKDNLESRFADTSELYISFKKEVNGICKKTLDEEVDLLRLNHNDLKKVVDILRNLPVENNDEVIKSQSEDIATLKEEFESYKQNIDDHCKEKLNEQYDSLRKDYVDLHNNVNESFKNVPRNKKFDEIVESQSEEITTLKEELELQKQNNIDLLAETKAYIDEQLPSLKGEKGSLERITAWQKDYPRKINEVVTHNNSLWQLKYNDSKDEPCKDSDDWRLLIAGLTSLEITPDNKNKVKLIVTDGSGKQYDNNLFMPVPNMLGTWDETESYKFYDNIAKDGCRWTSYSDNPQGVPGESKDWLISSQPAQRGKKGEKGDKGESGRTGLNGKSISRNEVITIMNEDT